MSTNILDQFQRDVVGRLLAHPFFNEVSVVAEDSGLLEADMEEEMAAVISVRAGAKAGAAIIVFQTEEEVLRPATEGPKVKARLRIRFLEIPKVNRFTGGTGLTAQAMCSEAEELFHLWFRDAKEVLVIKGSRYNDGEGTVGKDLWLGAELYHPQRSRCEPVEFISPAPITLLSGTPGASIYFTTDGSFPGPGPGSTATLYTTDVESVPGATLRAAAYKTGTLGSHVTEYPFPTAAGVLTQGGENLQTEAGNNLILE